MAASLVRKEAWLVGLLAAFALAGLSTEASAFCRITTCDPSEETCDRDDDDCSISGKPLVWASSCATIAIQENGSKRHGIDAETLEAVAVEALETWNNVDCGGGRRPSIGLESIGTVACDAVEYNASGNANILVVRDDHWPYPGRESTLGKTHLSFDPDDGRIFDADIEVNGTGADITVGDPVGGVDLLSVLTHEFGHFLGLDHSNDEDATMRADYLTSATTLRTLARDDIEGICTIYPPTRAPASSSCTPRHGFSAECGGNPSPPPGAAAPSGGCHIGPNVGGRPTTPWVLLALGLLSLRRVRPRARAAPRPSRGGVAAAPRS